MHIFQRLGCRDAIRNAVTNEPQSFGSPHAVFHGAVVLFHYIVEILALAEMNRNESKSILIDVASFGRSSPPRQHVCIPRAGIHLRLAPAHQILPEIGGVDFCVLRESRGQLVLR